MVFKKPTSLNLKYILVYRKLDNLVCKTEFLIRGELLYCRIKKVATIPVSTQSLDISQFSFIVGNSYVQIRYLKSITIY